MSSAYYSSPIVTYLVRTFRLTLPRCLLAVQVQTGNHANSILCQPHGGECP